MRIITKILKYTGFLFITIVLSFSVLAASKSKKYKKQIKNEEIESQKIDDTATVRYPHTKPVFLKSKNAIILDFTTGKILLEKKAHERVVPGSMTKMMTSYLIEEKLKSNEASIDMLLPVSEKAWRMQGSKTFVPLGENVRLDDMLKGIIIQSGNDACIVVAEGLYGSEANFVEAMNEMANKMALKDTHFDNSSGWPSSNQYSTVYDLAQLGQRLINDHPEYYSIYSEKSFTFGTDSKGSPITQGNRNPLLYEDLGCDGIKSGHTDEGGYGLVMSFVNDGRRYIAVISGLVSAKDRSVEAHRVLTWVKENFMNKKLYSKGEVVEQKAAINYGVKETIELIVNQDLYILLPRANPLFKTLVAFKKPLEAPVTAGDTVGEIKISYDSNELNIPISANESIEKIGIIKRLYKKIMPSS